MLNVSVLILKKGEFLELLVRGDSRIGREEIANAFEDGLRKPTEILVDAEKNIRSSPSGGYVLVCKPYPTDNMERTWATIRYELQFRLRHPFKTSH